MFEERKDAAAVVHLHSSHANAQYATEELEDPAKLFLILQNYAMRLLTPEQIADLRRFNLS